MSIVPTPPREQGGHAQAKAASRPPCAERPDDWDLDSGTPETWRLAVETCQQCPVLANCTQLAQTLIERSQAPRAMIWAGVGYDAAGHVIENLDRHRTAPVDHRKPTVIIRTNTPPAAPDKITDMHQHAPAPTAPRRQIVIHRGVRRTGTDG